MERSLLPCWPITRFADAQAALVAFESENPRAKEDVLAGIEQWLADAKAITQTDLAGVLVGAGGLQVEHLASATRAFVIQSDAFASWVKSQVDEQALFVSEETASPRQEARGRHPRLRAANAAQLRGIAEFRL